MADTIKGFLIGGVTKLVDWEGGVTNKPAIPTTIAELTDAGDYATKAQVSAHTTSVITALKDEGIYDAKGDAENAYGRASAYTDTQIQALKLSETYAAKSTVDTLVGTDTGKSVREVSAEEVAKIVASADTKYDTLKEIADYIASDITSAATMGNDIADLKKSAHTHTNATVLDSITSDKVNAWDNKQAALSDTDGGYGQRIKAVEDVLANAINFEAQTY